MNLQYTAGKEGDFDKLLTNTDLATVVSFTCGMIEAQHLIFVLKYMGTIFSEAPNLQTFSVATKFGYLVESSDFVKNVAKIFEETLKENKFEHFQELRLPEFPCSKEDAVLLLESLNKFDGLRLLTLRNTVKNASASDICDLLFSHQNLLRLDLAKHTPEYLTGLAEGLDNQLDKFDVESGAVVPYPKNLYISMESQEPRATVEEKKVWSEASRRLAYVNQKAKEISEKFESKGLSSVAGNVEVEYRVLVF